MLCSADAWLIADVSGQPLRFEKSVPDYQSALRNIPHPQSEYII